MSNATFSPRLKLVRHIAPRDPLPGTGEYTPRYRIRTPVFAAGFSKLIRYRERLPTLLTACQVPRISRYVSASSGHGAVGELQRGHIGTAIVCQNEPSFRLRRHLPRPEREQCYRLLRKQE